MTMDNNVNDIIYGHDDLRYLDKEYYRVLWIIYMITTFISAKNQTI